MIYYSLTAALKDGFHVYDKTATGYLMRIRRNDRWQLAIVVLAS